MLSPTGELTAMESLASRLSPWRLIGPDEINARFSAPKKSLRNPSTKDLAEQSACYRI